MTVLRRDASLPSCKPTPLAAATPDSAIKAAEGVVHSVVIGAPGSAGSVLRVFDGSVAAGTKIAEFDATKVGSYLLDARCASGIHVELVDSASTIRATINWI